MVSNHAVMNAHNSYVAQRWMVAVMLSSICNGKHSCSHMQSCVHNHTALYFKPEVTYDTDILAGNPAALGRREIWTDPLPEIVY